MDGNGDQLIAESRLGRICGYSIIEQFRDEVDSASKKEGAAISSPDCFLSTGGQTSTANLIKVHWLSDDGDGPAANK